jgi:hypothetical protein
MDANGTHVSRPGWRGQSVTAANPVRLAPARVESLEGRRLLAGQIDGLELWTAGNATDNKIFDVTPGLTYNVAAPGNTPRLDLKVRTSGSPGPINFEVFSPAFSANGSTRISSGTESTSPYAIGANDPNRPLDFFGRLRGPDFFGDGNEAPLYSLLALGSATSKRFVVRTQIAGQASFKEFVFTVTRGTTPVDPAPALTSVKIIGANGGALAGTGTGQLNLTGSPTVLNGVLSKKFSLVIAGSNLASAKLNLSGDSVAAAHGESAAPFSLYGDGGGTFTVKSFPKKGLYTLSLDLFSTKQFGGKTTHAEVTFEVRS